MVSKKLQGYLGLLKKGNYLIIGGDRLKEYNKKLYLILVTQDLSKNISKISSQVSQRYNGIPILKLGCEDIGECIGLNNCKILGIKNKGLADEILTHCVQDFEVLRGE